MLTRHHNGLFVRHGQHCKSDCHMVWSMFADDEYRFRHHGRRLPKACRVIDVGAHIGAASAMIHEHRPLSTHACVEPWRDHWEALDANNRGYGRVFRAAMSHDPCQTMRHCHDSVIGHLGQGPHVDAMARNNASVAWTDSPLDVPLVTLEHVLDSMRWDQCDLLKLDCEGAEHSILRHADLSRVGTIMLEWHGLPEWLETLSSLPGWTVTEATNRGDLGVAWLNK